MLALWLTRLGVRVRIIDKTSGPGTTSRALAVQARTLELYRQVGLVDAVVTQGRTLDELVTNLREAVALQLEGEDPASTGVVAEPRISLTYEVKARTG